MDNDNTVVWYEADSSVNPSELTFGEPKVISAETYNVLGVDTADMDADGDIDIVAYSEEYGVVSWFENDGGAGNFLFHSLGGGVFDGLNVYAVDLESDGDVDIASAWLDSDAVAWHENTLIDQVDVLENAIFVVLSGVTDEDLDQTLSYSIIGGEDSAFFEIDASGNVSFLAGKTIVNPEDADGDNVYEVVIAATDGFDTIEKEIHVTVLAAE